MTTGVHIEVREERYLLDLERFDQVIDTLNAMRLQGPNGPPSQGLTTYRIEPHWQFQPVPGGCAVIDAEIDVEIVVQMPRWPGAVRASAEDRSRWQSILAAITEHEYRHRDLVVASAGALFEELTQLRAGNCGTLRRAAQGAIDIANVELEQAHAEIDRGGRDGRPRPDRFGYVRPSGAEGVRAG